MTAEHRQKLLAAADERDASAARVEEALAQTRANRAAAVAEGQLDLARFDQAEAEMGEQLARYRRSAEAFRREAAGEPVPVRVGVARMD